MNMHARTIEPDFGSLLDTDDDVLEVADRRDGKMEPRLDAGPRPKAGLTLGPDDRIDAGSPGRALPVLSRQQAEDQPAATLIGGRALMVNAVDAGQVQVEDDEIVVFALEQVFSRKPIRRVVHHIAPQPQIIDQVAGQVAIVFNDQESVGHAGNRSGGRPGILAEPRQINNRCAETGIRRRLFSAGGCGPDGSAQSR